MQYSQEILFIYFLGASAFFSSVEASYLSMGRVAVNRFEKGASFFDRTVYFFITHFEFFLVSMLFFNLINNICSVWLFGKLLGKYFPSVAYNWVGYLIQLGGMTFILLLFCEITPKRIGIRYHYLFAYLSVIPMLPIYFLFYPISYLSRYLSNALLTWVAKGQEDPNPIDKGELMSYIKLSSDQGVLEDMESDMLQNLIRNKDLPVKSLLIPRPTMEGFDLSNLPENLPLAIRKFKYNVIPVYDKVKDNVKGVISKKKIFFQDAIADINKKNLPKYLETPKIVPENKNIIEVLEHMRHLEHEVSLVTDEYGGIEGFVTYQDIVSKLLAKSDNTDSEVAHIRKISPTVAIVNPLMSLTEFNKRFKTHLSCPLAETIGGFLTEKNNDIPPPGYSHSVGKIKISVKSSNKRRIQKLKVEVT